MGIHFTVDHSLQSIIATADGTITYADICKHLLEERTYGGLPYSELIDARTATPAFSASEVRELVAVLRRLGESNKLGPTAVVVGSPVAFGMVRMLEIIAQDVCAIRPFWNIEEGLSWLQTSEWSNSKGS